MHRSAAVAARRSPQHHSKRSDCDALFGIGIRTQPELRGIIPNSFEHIFSEISACQAGSVVNDLYSVAVFTYLMQQHGSCVEAQLGHVIWQRRPAVSGPGFVPGDLLRRN